ncbi:MAG: hypothetical protein JW774_06840 [Candidatus Aureabacteria bacterium]|nr:hypothetical protein [Candidatus Auribacterota bacterium]
MKKFFLLLLAGWISASFPVFGGNVKKENVSLGSNEEKIITITNLKGISNAGDIVETVLLKDGDSVMFRGIHWGDTQVTAWDESGNQWIYYIHVEVPKFIKELQGFLEDIEGVNVNFLGKDAVVEGQLLRKSDINRLNQILANYPQVKNMVSLNVVKSDELLLDAVKAEIYDPNVRCNFLGSGLMMEGTVLSPQLKSANESAAKFYFPSIYPALNIALPDFSFSLEWIGMKIPDSQTTDSSFSAFIQGVKKQNMKKLIPYTFFTVKNHEQMLTLISESGQSRILSQSKLNVQSGNKNAWEEKNPNGFNFTAELQPTIMDDNRVDCRITLTLTSAGTNLVWQTCRLVFNKGQSIAITGLRQMLESSLGDKKEILKNSAVLSAISSSNEEIILILTPEWSARQ